MRPPLVWWAAAVGQAIALGKRLVPWGSSITVNAPGAWVWSGFAHAFLDGCFVPTHRAWGAGEEPMVVLEEHDSFDPLPGLIEADEF